MKSLEEEARIHAGLMEGFDYADESYYQPTKINAYRSFKDGAKSKWVQAEKIKAQIEAVNHFCKLNGFAGTDRHKAVILMYEQQLKELEDESNQERRGCNVGVLSDAIQGVRSACKF